MKRPELTPELRAEIMSNWRAMSKRRDVSPSMSPLYFRDCLDRLGWSTLWLADHLGRSQTLVRRWENGLAPIPAPVAIWIEKLATFHRRHALPEGWSLDARVAL